MDTAWTAILFSFNGPDLTWISNAEHEMEKVLTELLARWYADPRAAGSRTSGR
jgi:hypothetical protein